jgi:fermentation-respiration switch protein FrsA (DUF1100 family)
MISWLKYNPRNEIKKLKIPTLFLNGTNDLQVSVGEAELLKKSKPDAELVIIDAMNHVFKEIKDFRKYEIVQRSKSTDTQLHMNNNAFYKSVIAVTN